jgi:hypothetical protein
LAYIPKSTRRPSLLTRSRPDSYRKTISPQNRVRNCSEKKLDKKSVQVLLGISLNTLRARLGHHLLKFLVLLLVPEVVPLLALAIVAGVVPIVVVILVGGGVDLLPLGVVSDEVGGVTTLEVAPQ